MSKKTQYVIIEPIGNTPKIKGKYDLYITLASGFMDILEELRDSRGDDELALHFVLDFQDLDDEEFKQFCERWEIDID